MQNRREFLQIFAAGAVARAESKARESREEWRNRQQGMAYRRLGRTGFMISEVVMGGNLITPENNEHILMALDMGLNYLDTAPAYGDGGSELGYAKVIRARGRDKFFLNTKVSLWDLNRNKLFRQIFDSLPKPEQKKLRNQAREEIERQGATQSDYFCDYFDGQRTEIDDAALSNVMEKEYGRRIDRGTHYKQLIVDSLDASLKRLGTDHVDLMMCPHGASTGCELLNFPEIFDAFEILKKAGKVRFLGVSAHTDSAGILRAAMKTKVYSAAMVAYNIVNHRFVDRALEQAREQDFGVIAMKAARPVFHGPDYNKADDPRRVKLVEEAVSGSWKIPQKAYLWTLQNPNLSAVISEMANAEMVEDNVPLAGRKIAA